MDYLRENCCADEAATVIPLKSITRRRKNANA
jgi:hypothetical protein